MIRFFKKLFKRGDFMTRADKAYYKYRAKTIFWSAFCLIIIAWVGTNLVLCALTTNVESNFDMIYEATQPVTLPTGQEFNRILKKATSFSDELADKKIKSLTFDKFTDGVEDEYFVDDVNVLKGAVKENVSVENNIYLYRTNGGADVYVLSNNKMQANPDSSWMFSNLSVMTYNFKNFDTSQVQSFSHAFSGNFGNFRYTSYTISTKAEVSKFQTLAADYGEFCPKIETLDLSMWDTSNVTDMSYMFAYCYQITKLSLTGWDTRKVTDMSYMFFIGNQDGFAERKATELDLSSFDTSSVINMSDMFGSTSWRSSGRDNLLQTIYVSDRFVVDQVETSDDMFEYCANLVGAQGTAWASSNPTDKTYAHIDGKDGQKGYFTEKPFSGKE